ncbi:MAG TPA: VOC family protein [Bacilli bacterium]|nr:VOC family protein [Bacilli bacterium]
MPATKPHLIRFDGSMILTENRHLAIEWYKENLGLTLAWDSPDEEMALLLFPNHMFSLALKTAPEELLGDLVIDPRVYLCLAAPNLQNTLIKLRTNGVVTTDIYQGPTGDAMFDFFDLDGTRLTAVSMAALAEADPAIYALGQEFPDAPFVAYMAHRIGVSDLPAMSKWYQEYLGLQLFVDLTDLGTHLLGWPCSAPVWLEQREREQFDGKEQTTSRIYILTPDLEGARSYFQGLGMETSEVQGQEGQLRTFYTYDPDGNQLHLWSYPEAG